MACRCPYTLICNFVVPSHSNSGWAMILTLVNGIIENVIQEEAKRVLSPSSPESCAWLLEDERPWGGELSFPH